MDMQKQRTTNRYDKCSNIDTSFYEQFDIEYVMQKYPNAKEFLILRLGKAISKRRRWLKYRELHSVKLAQFLDTMDHTDEDFRTIYSETTATTFDAPDVLVETQRSEYAGDTRTEITVNSDATPTVLEDTTAFNLGALRHMPSMSTIATETSYATTLGNEGRLRMPDIPSEAQQSRPFECPYCHKIASVADTHAWMRHVYRDLQPYTCTFESCNTGEFTYESRRRWFSHEIQNHRRIWSCFGHCDEEFDRRDIFEEHLKRHNERSISPAQIKSLADMVAQYPDRINTLFDCPLCMSRITGATNLEKHLGRHLERPGTVCPSST